MDYENQVVSRSAPRWAWDVMETTLAVDSRSNAFDASLRKEISDALAAMIVCSEEPDLEEFPRFTEVQ